MKPPLLSLIFILIINSTTSAQSTTKDITISSLKAMGAANNPKVEVAWNRYYDWKEIGDICLKLQKMYPNLVKYGSIGKSVEGKDLHLLTVTNFKNGDPDRKPGIYIDGNIHSNEVQGSEVALYTAWYLVENYNTVPWIGGLLDDRVFYIVPTINPDARDHFIHEANTPHSPRSGLLPRDDDGDGEFDEDGFDDLDNDGNIVMMRKRDPNGRWTADSDDSRLIIPAKEDQKGEYTLLGWEGIDNDGDGLVNEDGPGFYDPNRNWAWNWQPAYFQYGADQYPFSIPEDRAVSEFVLQNENIGAAQSFHNSGGMILRGPGAADDDTTFNRQDLEGYDFLGKLGEEMLPGYRYLVLYKDLYPAYGGELDWFYGARGIFTFSNELWTSFDYFRRQDEQRSERSSGQKSIYRFDKILLFGEGIIDWKSVDHPQYGKIEIGGVKKAWTRTAPSFLLEDLCHRNMAFTLFHAYHLPKLAIDSIAVKNLPGDLRQIDVIITNSRVLPSRSAHEIKNNITPPDYVALSGDNIKVIAGFVVEDPYLNISQEQKYKPSTLKIDSIPGMGTRHVRWIVSGKTPFNVIVDSKKGGLISKRYPEI